ncbi:carboxyl-terminal-processing peptidase 2, chloroplastic isoform X2 [Oryza glaberrima]|uniref:carboxyl-terminal-processing peptidase 2, chloroplastic isoform X2 n=1 Tax=Oryza glaberrima TaxID=4538 RepID=UPI00224C4698|nr:carboxyl-terminal-processing peptidase 2, chloroplastic isoform X2 [Oryza glaberrima]
MATCSRPLFVPASAAAASPSPAASRRGAPLVRLHAVAIVSIWEPRRHLRAHMSLCCKATRRSSGGLTTGHPISALPRAIKRILSSYPSLLTSLGGNLARGYKAAKPFLSIGFGRVVLGMVLVMSVSAATYTAPSSSALTEENLLFLEAWRAVDRAYYDKSFNGQSWFRYRENALRNEPMNTREETYAAIKKMLSTLDDPFTRFLEPEKFKSLRSGSQGTLTGVGLSISYPMALNGSPSGLSVMSATPGGPAENSGILPGDVILAIDNRSTEDMDIYDAAQRLQGPEGSSVDLDIRSGSNTRHVVLKRQTVTLNPVRSRMCEIPGAKDNSKVGYIKLTTFNQNAAGSVKEALQKLRENNVKSFVLDLRNNSGGLFPEGIEIAKIWMDKGVIVYICDSQGVRDIYEADGISTVAASEPLVVLVCSVTAQLDNGR